MKKFLKSLLEDIINTETFKRIQINDKDTNYLISSLGKVYTTNLYGKTNKFKELNYRISSNVYKNIGIHLDGKTYTYSIHF